MTTSSATIQIAGGLTSRWMCPTLHMGRWRDAHHILQHCFADVLGGVSSEFDSKPLAIAAGVTKRMPNGPCLRYRNFVYVSYRVGFQDASGNLVTMGDAWRLRQCSGAWGP